MTPYPTPIPNPQPIPPHNLATTPSFSVHPNPLLRWWTVTSSLSLQMADPTPTCVEDITQEWLSTTLGRAVTIVSGPKAAVQGHTQCLKVFVSVAPTSSPSAVEHLFVKCHRTEYTEEDEVMVQLHAKAQKREIEFYTHVSNVSIIPSCVVALPSGVLVLDNPTGANPSLSCLSMQDPPLSLEEMGPILDAYAVLHTTDVSLPGVFMDQDALMELRNVRWETAVGEGSAVERMTALCDANPELVADGTREALLAAAEEGYCMPVVEDGEWKDHVVLSHGDANPNNILRDASDNSITLIDFQEPAMAHPSFDLGWLLVTSVSEETRREGGAKAMVQRYLEATARLGAPIVPDLEAFFPLVAHATRMSALLILVIVGPIPIDTSTWIGRLLASCLDAIVSP